MWLQIIAAELGLVVSLLAFIFVVEVYTLIEYRRQSPSHKEMFSLYTLPTKTDDKNTTDTVGTYM